MSDRDTLAEDLDNARDLFEQSVDIAECLIDGEKRALPFHPTWELEYLTEETTDA